MKKGQISIFIIISVVIIMSTIFIVKVNNEAKINNINQDLKFGESNEGLRVREFVESCLKQQTELGIDISLYFNGNYQNGDYGNMPVFPTLLTYDLWLHDFQKVEPTLRNFELSLSKYLDDTMVFCLSDFKTLNNIEIESDHNQIKFEIKTKKNDVTSYLYFPIQIINKDQTVTKLSKFEYTSKNVPINQIREDVSKILTSYTNILKSVDGKTNGSTRIVWGDLDSAISTIDTSNPNSRQDLLLLVNSNGNEVDFVLKYNKPYRETFYLFNIKSNTGQSIAECRYCNNVENQFFGTFQTLNPSANIIENNEFFKNNFIFGGETE